MIVIAINGGFKQVKAPRIKVFTLRVDNRTGTKVIATGITQGTNLVTEGVDRVARPAHGVLGRVRAHAHRVNRTIQGEISTKCTIDNRQFRIRSIDRHNNAITVGRSPKREMTRIQRLLVLPPFNAQRRHVLRLAVSRGVPVIPAVRIEIQTSKLIGRPVSTCLCHEGVTDTEVADLNTIVIDSFIANRHLLPRLIRRTGQTANNIRFRLSIPRIHVEVNDLEVLHIRQGVDTETTVHTSFHNGVGNGPVLQSR